MSKPPKSPHQDEAPKTVPNAYFGWQQQLADDPPNTVADIGPLPSGPWSSGPGPGDEPLIEGDSNTMDVAIDQLNR
jgi:hypothetical protein